MKRLFFIIVLVSITICCSAQNLTISNLENLFSLNYASAISKQLRATNYRLCETIEETDKKYASVNWYYNNIVYNDYDEDWGVPRGQKFYMVEGTFDDGKVKSLSFGFQTSSTYSSIKQQLKSGGWKLENESIKNSSLMFEYSKPNSTANIILSEGDDVYLVTYTKK